jgi:tRNA pseudouridine-54 N-methylase
VLFNELPIDKASVKSGENNPQVVTAARCVNVGLFLSNDLRRDVEVIIGIVQDDELKTITFPGETLRRVSPDERSIAFFLLKASAVLQDLPEKSEQVMDNGIVVKRTDLEIFVSGWPYGQVFVASDDASSSISNVKTSEGLFIYPRGVDTPQLEKYGALRCTATPERFILDINLHFDSNEGP